MAGLSFSHDLSIGWQLQSLSSDWSRSSGLTGKPSSSSENTMLGWETATGVEECSSDSLLMCSNSGGG